MILSTKKTANTRLRYNILTMLVYVIGLILIAQLFNLQIVNGEEYREESNTRLTRETTIEAARGTIRDRTGIELAATKLGNSLEMYKTKIETEQLNECILKIVQVLDKNGDKYVDTFPIKINPYEFTFSTENGLKKWKTNYKIDENATAEECFNFFLEKYKINCESVEQARKVLGIIYTIKTKGYSATKALEIAEEISNASVQEFYERSSEFPGVNVVAKPIRTYPKGNLGSHILGYIAKINEDELKTRKDTYSNDDYIGRTGIEYVFEEYLRGTDGQKQIDMAVDGTQTGEYITQEAIAGNDVVLTIDANIQQIAETALQNNIEKIKSGGFSERYDAKGGSVVVVNVKTGEVLALVSYPTYSPDAFYNGISQTLYNEYLNTNALFNRAISGTYEPGSIFKMITAIAGLEEGVVSTTERIYDTGIYKKYNKEWKCWYFTDYRKGHGSVDISEAIKHSCNYFFYEIGDRLGIDRIGKYAKYFGLGTKTGIELPSEARGSVATMPNGPGDVLNAAIGQGNNSYTPLQMAKYIAMLTNGGKHLDLTLIKSILKPDKTEVDKNEIERYVNEKLGLNISQGEDLQISEEYINDILEGMKSVAGERGGTAYSVFKNFNIEIGGKTGSAETATTDVNAWFTAFAPFDEPEIAVVVMVENGGHGSYTAEVARDIIAEYFGMNANGVTEDMTAVPYTETLR